MKPFLAFVLIIASVASFAQANKKVKLYAYEQRVLPGVRKVTIDENGVQREAKPKTFSHYYIYLEAPSSKKVEVKHIWIRGKQQNVTVEKPTLPAVVYNISMPGRKADTLVRQRLNPVLQIVPSPASDSFQVSYAVRQKMKKNEIVVHTIENGKDCFYYLESIKMLDPLALQ